LLFIISLFLNIFRIHAIFLHEKQNNTQGSDLRAEDRCGSKFLKKRSNGYPSPDFQIMMPWNKSKFTKGWCFAGL